MEIGWIDFSDSDRKKALGVISMMDEEGAVDEIGIGKIRDAFANIFFPGTSTIMTRAKYFFIVPYAFMEAVRNKNLTNYKMVINEVEEVIEKDCAKTMKKQYPERGSGIIGTVSLPNKWVSRKPSSIYWNGLRQLGIFTWENISSIESYVKIAIASRGNELDKSKSKSDDDENDSDDLDAGHRNSKPFWNVPQPDKNWRKNLSINLSKEEAGFLRDRISDKYQDTIFKSLVDNNVRLPEKATFEQASELFYDLVSDTNKHLIDLANKFNLLVTLIRIRYNKILTRGMNSDVMGNWDLYKERISEIAEFNVRNTMAEVGVNDLSARLFLEQSQSLLLNGNISELDDLIIKREKALKGSRAKLPRANEYNPNGTLVAWYQLDYRMGTARRIINDIFDAEGIDNGNA